MSKVILPPPPLSPPRIDGLVDEDSNEFGVTEWEYQWHLDEIDELVREANANQTTRPVNGGLKPLDEKVRAIFLTWIRSKIRAAGHAEQRKFYEMVEGFEF